MENKQFGLHFGALSDPISKQIEAQGFKFKKEEVQQFQEYADAIVLLRIGGLLADSHADKIKAKLYKQIVSHIKKTNKLKSA